MADASYDQIVAALLSARRDLATARFDDELARAEAAGTVDGPTARTLRWWQRQSVTALEEHITDTLPQVLAALAASDTAAREALDASADAWASAQPPAAPAAPAAPTTGPGAEQLHVVDDATARHDGPAVTLAPVTELPMRSPDHDRPGPGFTSHLLEPATPRTTAPLNPPQGSRAGTGAPRPRLLGSGLSVLGEAPRPEDR